MAGKIRNLDPGKNQKSVVTENEVKELLSILFFPSNPSVSRRKGPSGRRRKQKTANLSLARQRRMLETRAPRELTFSVNVVSTPGLRRCPEI